VIDVPTGKRTARIETPMASNARCQPKFSVKEWIRIGLIDGCLIEAFDLIHGLAVDPRSDKLWDNIAGIFEC